MKTSDILLFSAMGACMIIFFPIGLVLLMFCIFRAVNILEGKDNRPKGKMKKYTKETLDANK